MLGKQEKDRRGSCFHGLMTFNWSDRQDNQIEGKKPGMEVGEESCFGQTVCTRVKDPDLSLEYLGSNSNSGCVALEKLTLFSPFLGCYKVASAVPGT